MRKLSMEARMTVCNMSIEAGARAGMIAPDEATFGYLEGRRFVPRGNEFQELVAQWRTLASDPAATFDAIIEMDATQIAPQVTWGTNPGMVTSITGCVPEPHLFADPNQQRAAVRALEYMRQHVQPQLRRSPGQGWSYTPREPSNGSGCRDYGPLRGYPRARC